MFFFLTYLNLYNRLQFHSPHENWFKCILFNGWVIFHYVYVPQLPYPFICQWTSRLLPRPGYCKQCPVFAPRFPTISPPRFPTIYPPRFPTISSSAHWSLDSESPTSLPGPLLTWFCRWSLFWTLAITLARMRLTTLTDWLIFYPGSWSFWLNACFLKQRGKVLLTLNTALRHPFTQDFTA